MKTKIRLIVYTLGVALLSGSAANASYMVDVGQVGSNVVATGSGAIDLTDLTLGNPSGTLGVVIPSDGIVAIGMDGTDNNYSGISGPASIGSGGITFADTATGAGIYIDGANPSLGVPQNYVSGSTLGTSTAVFDSTTIADLGLTDGTYTWTWGTGADADSFVVNVGTPAAVPEPSSIAVLLAGLSLIGGAMYFGRKKAKTA